MPDGFRSDWKVPVEARSVLADLQKHFSNLRVILSRGAAFPIPDGEPGSSEGMRPHWEAYYLVKYYEETMADIDQEIEHIQVALAGEGELRSAAWRKTSAFVNALSEQHEKARDDWKERFERINEALGNYTVPFLRMALNKVNGGTNGHIWSSAKSDELMREADRIITGTNEVLKAKLIACRYKP
jgi:hypothetical protein